MEKKKAHHSQPDTDKPTELQHPTPSISPRDGRHVVEVAAVRDREVCLTKRILSFDCRRSMISADIVCCSAAGAH
jgi:hypothetical protein